MSTQAVLFLVGFLAILFAYIGIMVYVVKRLDRNISKRRYDLIERLFIGGILLSVVAMFQTWVFVAYKFGFLLLLVSTLGFIIWNHVTPRGALRDADVQGVSLSDIESGP